MASPKHFYRLAGILIPWLAVPCLLLTLAGLYYGLVKAPPDYQQGDSYRIMFIHVPAAWMSMFIYVVMAGAGAIGLIWRIKLAEMVAISSAPIGASFTFLVKLGHRRSLVQGIPPLDRIMNDRNIDDADQRQDGNGPRRHALVINGIV